MSDLELLTRAVEENDAELRTSLDFPAKRIIIVPDILLDDFARLNPSRCECNLCILIVSGACEKGRLLFVLASGETRSTGGIALFVPARVQYPPVPPQNSSSPLRD